ncbi:phosphatase PAP2 family protein [Sorangium sp. So ce260]|uniref:phosphatase PAP2 family protein n=1 Tax=Sorangium sp. So ce260 TaxID=3133291 RepID=UPI003F648407
MLPHRKSLLGAAVALALTAPAARAEPPLVSPAPPQADRAQQEPIAWNGRDLHPLDYAATAALVIAAATEMSLPVGNDAKRSGGVLFDDAIRDAMMLRDPDDRSAADLFGDVSMMTLTAYPAVVDAGVTAWLYRGSPMVALNMIVIDLQAYSFSSLVTGAFKRIADRERPIGTECRGDPGYDPSCSTAGQHYSFISGHTSMSFTGAGLTCTHHAALGLLGREGDVLSCVTAMTLATSVGLSRIAADKHYTTDVLGGAAVGLLSGLLLPYLVYYGPGRSPAALSTGGGVVAPLIGGSFLGAVYVGAL